MATTRAGGNSRGQRCVGPAIRRWLQAGAATAGLGVALLIVPAPAAADSGPGRADAGSAGAAGSGADRAGADRAGADRLGAARAGAAPARGQRGAVRSTHPRADTSRVVPVQSLRSASPVTPAVPTGAPVTVPTVPTGVPVTVPTVPGAPVTAPTAPALVPVPAPAAAPPAAAPPAAAPAAAPTPDRPVPGIPVADLLAGAWMRRASGAAVPSGPVPAPAGPVPVACGAAGCDAAVSAPPITVHNDSATTIWVYNLTTSGDYSIPADFQPVAIPAGGSAPVTLAAGTGPLGTPENRIYFVEGEQGLDLPVVSPGGIDAFNPTAATAGTSFRNYSFIEYFSYSAATGDQYTIDVSYIDEWSLPVQFEFTVNGADWTGAVSGKTYGFKDYDTVASQLRAAGGPYGDLIWSGSTPWVPQPPATVHRIIGPDKVWSQQSTEPAANVNMNVTGWVPTSYQDFVQYGGPQTYPYAQDGTQYSPEGNFTFWKNAVTAPASTPYPVALRTAAMLDGFPADANGVYGFFTYPNDETAGQFTNIPTAVALDIHVHGSSDGASDSVIGDGQWLFSGPLAPAGTPWRTVRKQRPVLAGTAATDTFILDRVFGTARPAPRLIAGAEDRDIVVIDATRIAGAVSTDVDVVDRLRFGAAAGYDSQFVYERASGYLYYDSDPSRPGLTGVLANLSQSSIDPEQRIFVL